MSIDKKNVVVIKNKKKFILFMACSLLLVATLIIIIFSTFKEKTVNDKTDISRLNANKYSQQILNKYNQDKMMDMFIEDCESVQNKITIYILNNSTLEESSFKNIINGLRKGIEKSDFKIIDKAPITVWNGKWILTDEGNIKFKFANKNIEPDWKNNEQVKKYIVLN
ncbi:MAG: hypothetical protein RSB67_02640 [Clostridia bacterium]